MMLLIVMLVLCVDLVRLFVRVSIVVLVVL